MEDSERCCGGIGARHVILAAALLAVIIEVATAGTTLCNFGFYIASPGVCAPDLFMDWATITVAISVMIMAMAYAIAISLDSPRLINYTRGELWQVLATMVIILFFKLGLGFLNSIGPALYNINIAHPLDAPVRTSTAIAWTNVNQHSIDYLRGLQSDLNQRVGEIGRLSTIVGIISSLTVNIETKDQSFYGPILPAAGSIVPALSMVVGTVAASIVQLQLQISLMGLWQQMLSILLPFGIALRAFPLTRGAGGAMIAIVFSFVIILPLMYLLVEDVAGSYWRTSGCADHPKITGTAGVSIVQNFGALKSKLESLINENFQPGHAFACIAFKAGVEATLLPLFGYLMALNAARKLSELFGTEVDLSSLVRLI